MNLYGYVRGDPVNRVDPWGLYDEDDPNSPGHKPPNSDPYKKNVWEPKLILPSADAVVGGVIAIPRAVLEPVFIVVDTVHTVGAAAWKGGRVDTREITMVSALGERFRRNAERTHDRPWYETFMANTRATVVTAAALPTGGGSVLVDNIGTVFQENMSPQAAADLLGGAAAAQTVQGLGISAFSRATGSGWGGRGRFDVPTAQAMIDSLIAKRRGAGDIKNRANDTYARSLLNGRQSPVMKNQKVGDSGMIHAEPQVVGKGFGQRMVVVDQVPCKLPGHRCGRMLSGLSFKGAIRVVVPQAVDRAVGKSPKSAARRAAGGTTTVRPRSVLYRPFFPPVPFKIWNSD